MKKTIKLKQNNLFRLIFLYFISMIISNYIKTNTLISNLIPINNSTALFSGHISSIVSSIFIIVLILIIFAICYFVRDIFFEDLELKSIYNSLEIIIITFILVEIIRIFLIYFVLLDEIKKIDINSSIVEQLNLTDWYYYNNAIYSLLVILGSVIFFVDIYIQEKKIIPALVFGLIFFFCFYLINVNILDF